MAANLVEIIQKNLGYPELRKIDPNTQIIKDEKTSIDPQHLGQAAIPAVLLGLYKYGSTEQGSHNLLHGNTSTSWMNLFFTDKKEEVISKVASYSGVSNQNASNSMERIASEAVKIIGQQTPDDASFTNVKSYVSQQRSNILLYLPAELQLSSIIDDNTLDDRTNKMEGPMSSAMHFIENLFSGSTTEKNEVRPEDK